ncbi:MAG TPA: hypothetical protein EYH53_01700 [Methanothermococcus okinawensis]|nr:hypothetical protein [Methanothermococcus okinawensis]
MSVSITLEDVPSEKMHLGMSFSISHLSKTSWRFHYSLISSMSLHMEYTLGSKRMRKENTLKGQEDECK